MKLNSIKGIPLSYIQSILKIDATSHSGLTWLPRTNVTKQINAWNNRCANKPAGNKYSHNGYKRWRTNIAYNGKQYSLKSHRIIFLLHYGYLTKGKCIDHIDNNSLNNKIENLRECTKSQNAHNSKLSKKNTSGCKGVYWCKKIRKWRVIIYVNRKFHNFGYYVNKEDAIKVAIKARKKLHGKFGRDK